MIKMAWFAYLDGEDPALIYHGDIKDIDNYPGAPSSRLNGTQAPTQSFYWTLDDGRTLVSEHGWSADTGCIVDRHKKGLVKRFKPRERYPETSVSWVNLPDDSTIRSHDASQACEWPSAVFESLSYLKDEGHIEIDEDLDTNYLRWAFETLKTNRSGPFQAGYDFVSPQSKITIVVGCPVQYDPRTRENLKRIVARAASEAKVGMVVPANFGRVIDAETAEYEVETTYRHDLTNVYLVTEPNAALLFFMAKALSHTQCEQLVSYLERSNMLS